MPAEGIGLDGAQRVGHAGQRTRAPSTSPGRSKTVPSHCAPEAKTAAGIPSACDAPRTAANSGPGHQESRSASPARSATRLPGRCRSKA